MKTMLLMAYEFFKTGLFAMGGGLATLPFLYNISAKYGWYTTQDISDMIAISESTPGPLGINMSTFVGYKMFGLPGAVVASLSLILPSVIVIVIVAKVLDRFKNSIVVKRIFYGIRAASTGLIAAAGLLVAKLAFLSTGEDKSWGFDWKSIILAAVLLISIKTWGKKLHPIFFIVVSAAVGIIFKFQ